MNKRQFPRLSISHYAILFLLLVATFFIGIGYFTLNRIEQTRAEINVQSHESAEKELQFAISGLISDIFKLSEQVSAWDEVFQQLESPAYYSYWREYRLFQNEFFPEYIGSAEVYNINGYALANLPNSKFPYKIDIKSLRPSIEFKNNEASLMIYLPIQRDSKIKRIKGYLGVSLPFLSTLKKSSQFRFIENMTLEKKLHKKDLSVEEVVSLISYNVKSNPEADKMISVVKTSVVQIATIVGFLCLIFYFFLVYLLGRPLIEMSQYIDRLSNSSSDYLKNNLQSNYLFSELENIKTSLNQYHLDLEHAQHDLDDKNQELWQQAHHDSLTGVLNRRAFDKKFNKSQKLLRNNRISIGLILFDINRFKAINDSYGHQVGDDVLKAISACLQKALRKAENLYRIGGDEFAAIIIGHTPEEKMILAKRCVKFVNNYAFKDIGIKENVSISCGISHCQANEIEMLNNLQWQADIAVYQAKRPSGSNPILFHQDMVDGTESVFSSWMSDAVYEAVTDGKDIQMHYQPIVDSATRKTIYHEALIRICHEKECIPPSHIFPIIAMRQLETELDRQVIKKVVKDLKHKYLTKGSGVSVNLSAESVVHKDLIKWLKPLMKFTKSHKIVLEVTETSLITQLNIATHNLESLRKLGFKIALDDFGSGYSSLRYLTSMPVDIIKFDIALIQGMLDKRLGALVHEMANMLHKLGYELVAEGIETEELLEKVNKAGFNLSQGYLLGKPTRNGKT